MAEGEAARDLPAGRCRYLSDGRALARCQETAKFFVMGLPCIVAGTWLGLKLFGRIDEAMFRKIVLALLFASGAALMF
jgi:hypothetical protein